MRVLLIEDDDDSRALFREVLADFGIAACCAVPNELPEQDHFEAVLTDLPQPRAPYSSATAREWVTGLRTRYRAPVLVLTGHSEAQTDPHIAALAQVLVKPIDIDVLVERLRTAARS